MLHSAAVLQFVQATVFFAAQCICLCDRENNPDKGVCVSGMSSAGGDFQQPDVRREEGGCLERRRHVVRDPLLWCASLEGISDVLSGTEVGPTRVLAQACFTEGCSLAEMAAERGASLPQATQLRHHF